MGMDPRDGRMHPLGVDPERLSADREAELKRGMADLSKRLGVGAAGPFVVGAALQGLTPRLDSIHTFGLRARIPAKIKIENVDFAITGAEIDGDSVLLKIRSVASMSDTVEVAEPGDVAEALGMADSADAEVVKGTPRER